LRKATAFEPRTVYETMAQAEARRRIDQLKKNTPCPLNGEQGACL